MYFMGGRSPLPKTRDMDFCVQIHWWTSRGYFRMTLESKLVISRNTRGLDLINEGAIFKSMFDIYR